MVLNQASPVRIADDRDPVAKSVEELLCKLARKKGARLTVSETEIGEVEVRFETVALCAENRDIAILRLAGALLENQRFTSDLTQSLRRVPGLRQAWVAQRP